MTGIARVPRTSSVPGLKGEAEDGDASFHVDVVVEQGEQSFGLVVVDLDRGVEDRRLVPYVPRSGPDGVDVF